MKRFPAAAPTGATEHGTRDEIIRAQNAILNAALLSKRSMKGAFITTSSFPSNAHDFVASIDRRIILIDGERLASLMIQFNLGVSVAETIQLKEVDYDYFGG